jgi:hypothetical protein
MCSIEVSRVEQDQHTTLAGRIRHSHPPYCAEAKALQSGTLTQLLATLATRLTSFLE